MTTYKRFPKLLIQKEKNRADRYYIWQVGPDGKRRKVTFGPVTDPESVTRYEAARKAFEASSETQTVTVIKGACVTVANLFDRFFIWSRGHYVKHGEPTGSTRRRWFLTKDFLTEYGKKLTSEIGIGEFENYQEYLVIKGYTRSSINNAINDLKFIFRWGARRTENGVRLVSAETIADINLVESLKRGYTKAKEPPKKYAVPISDVEAVLPLLSSSVRGLVLFQLLTGCRPQEARIARYTDITRKEEDLWEYRPSRYKTERFDEGRERKVIYLGPRAIELVKEFEKHKINDYVFSPQIIKNGSRLYYSADTYYDVIQKACKKAGVTRFTPYQLRKAKADEIDRKLGAEAAAIALGHRDSQTTLLYYISPRDEEAREIARKFG